MIFMSLDGDHIWVCFFFVFFNKFIYYFILFLAALGLRCCTWTFSSCGDRGATLRCGVRASHCSGFSCCRAWALGVQASVVAARRLSSCGSRAVERWLSSRGAWAQLLHGSGIFPDQGPNPCPLHWQADSQLLRHHGSPIYGF